MSKSGILKLLCCSLLLTGGIVMAKADDNGAFSGYAPYSIYGVGDLFSGGSAYNMTMGGVGIASRNNRFVNTLNPAAVTARDSLAFMSDFSLYQNNKIFRQGSQYGVSNLVNINDIVISFPLFNHTAMMLGIKPYSSTGYDFSHYDVIPGMKGNLLHSYSGQGSLYQVFASFGVNLFKNLNLGAEYIHYTGNLKKTYTQKFSDAAAIGIDKTEESILSANSAKFGIQYEQPVGKKLKFVLGATYKLDARLNGYVNTTEKNGSIVTRTVSDTLAYRTEPLRLAAEAGIGLAVVYNRNFRAEVDYSRSDWSKAGFGTMDLFTPSTAESYRIGFEYIPRPNDVRYYRNIIAYRAGAYFNKEYYRVNGQPVYARGLTFGVTLPVFQWYNGLTLGFEIGQRGSLKNDLVRETYFNFSLGINLFDIWFQQYRYE